MMQDTDLDLFLKYFSAAGSIKDCNKEEQSINVIYDPKGLFSSEIWRLSRSLRIAAVAKGDSLEAASAADQIWTALGQTRCRSFEDEKAWISAIRWAISQGSSPYGPGNVYSRQNQVGLAWRRMTNRGFDITVGAHGLDISPASQTSILKTAETYVRLIGGLEVLQRISGFLGAVGRVHDGMWILGDQVPGIHQSKTPSLPVGWLYALAIKHVGVEGTARKPAVAWKSLVDLCTDMAACLDCERYNQFEGMYMQPSEFWRTLQDSLFWREFFTLPQVPTVTIKVLAEVLPKIVEEFGGYKAAKDVKAFMSEAYFISLNSDPLRLMRHPKPAAMSMFPMLSRRATGRASKINKNINDIFSADEREHEQCIFFEINNREFVSLPSPIINAAICESIFRLIWHDIPDVADKIVGKAMEAALASACKGKTASLMVNQVYFPQRSKRMEMDIACRDDDRIVMLETKAKSLTNASRQTGSFTYISDFTKSFLFILKQLMEHERYIISGHNPLVAEGEDHSNFRPLKIAVSPLSFGQLSDKVLAGSIITGMLSAELTCVEGRNSGENIATIRKFNKAYADVKELLIELAPKDKDGLAQIAPYLIDVFWVDLGQALYVLDRAKSVSDAFSPLKHITFSTRDFWTEIATADRGLLTKDRWRAVSQAVVASTAPSAP